MTELATDWSVLELDGVMDMVSKVARRISNDDMPLLHQADVEQEGYIILATKADIARLEWEKGGNAHLGHWLRRRILDVVRTEQTRMGKQVSYEDSRDNVPEFDTKEDRRADREFVSNRTELERIDLADLEMRREAGVA